MDGLLHSYKTNVSSSKASMMRPSAEQNKYEMCGQMGRKEHK